MTNVRLFFIALFVTRLSRFWVFKNLWVLRKKAITRFYLPFLTVLLAYGHVSLALNRAELGTNNRFKKLTRAAACEALLVTASKSNQLRFSRDFLKYDANDFRTGLMNALIAFFPRTEVLFSDDPLPMDKVNKNSISYQLRRNGYREADRTLTSIVLLQKILLGEDPAAFTTPIAPLNPGQSEITKIRQIVFDFLTDQPGVTLDLSVFAKVKIEKLHAMLVRLIIHDQGKFDQFIGEYNRRLQDSGIDTPTLSADHDMVLTDIQSRYPYEMMPSVTTVHPDVREHMEKSDIGAFNPGRVFQFEAPASHLAPLASLSEQTFKFMIIKEIFDVGGARGSEFPEGSFWIKPVITTYFRLYDDYMNAKIGKEPRQVVKYYHSLLKSAGEEIQLPTQTKEDLAVVKLARLFRLNQFPDFARTRRIDALVRAVQALDPGIRSRIINELEKDGIEDGWAFTLGYVPQVAENIQSSLGAWAKKTPAEEQSITDSQIDRAMNVSLDVLFRALQLARMSLKGQLSGNGEYTLELPKIADFIKQHGVDALINSEFLWRTAGRNSAEIVAKPRTELPNDTRRAPISHLWNGATGLFGEGGGADAVTAAQILNTAMLEDGFNSRFSVPVVVSVRTVKMGSSGFSGQEGGQRSLTNPIETIAPGVTIVSPNSQMVDPSGKPVGRFFEANIARAFHAHGLSTAVVLIEHDGNVQRLAAKYEAVRNRFKLRTILGIDTGGDKFGAENGNLHATVDQDQEAFEAGRTLFRQSHGTLTHLVAVAGIGFDSPSYAPDIYKKGYQTDWNSSHPNWSLLSKQLLAFWDEIGLNGNQVAVQQNAYYSRTQHALLQAVQGVRGLSTTALPIANVISGRNPWDPKVYIQSVSAAVITMDGSELEHFNRHH
jgi:hypothetical protein